jgi:hypothetical protein
MAESTLRKSLKKFGLPTSRKAFIKAYDGDVDALAELQQAVEAAADTDPELYEMFTDAMLSGGGPDDIVDSLANSLYPEKTGVRGRTDAVTETVEGNLPNNAADAGTLEATPYESLSAADKKKLEKAGFPASDVSSWTADDLKNTLAGLGTQSKATGGKKATGAKAGGKKATGQQAQKAAAAGTPPASQAATQQTLPLQGDNNFNMDEYLASDEAPVVGGFGMSRADLEGDAPATAAPFARLNRDSAGDYLESLNQYIGEADDVDLEMYGPPPPPPPATMDMAALGGMPSLNEVLAGSPQFQGPPMDMSRLANSPTLADLLLEPNVQRGPYRTGQLDSNFDPVTPMPGDAIPPGTMNPEGGFGGVEYGPSPFNDQGGFALGGEFGPPPPSAMDMTRMSNSPSLNDIIGPSPAHQPNPNARPEKYRPVGSRVEEFMKARGLGGINTRPVTAPVDFAIRNAPWLAAGGAGYSYMNSGGGPTPEQQDAATRAAEESARMVEEMYGPEAIRKIQDRMQAGQ